MEKTKYIYGPVPSRRLGISLGVSPIPKKTCNYSCIYCQLGRTKPMTNSRKMFFSVEEIIHEFDDLIQNNIYFDVVTIVGEGEPTLYLGLGKIIAEIKKRVKKPVAVITNGALLYDKTVRQELLQADIVLPSMDAFDEASFEMINRPYKNMIYKDVYSGLIEFSKIYQGQLWLEIMVILGTIGYHLDKIATLIVVIFIVKTGFGILKDGVKVLLDASVDYETLSKTEKIILNTSQVVEIKKLTGRNSGRFKFIEANIVIKTHNLDKAHLIADKIENQIKQELSNIDHVLIHYEPMQKEEMIYVIPLTEEKNKISSHFGEAPWFMFVTFKTGERVAKQAEVMVNPFMNEEKGKGILAAEFLIKKGIDVVIVKKDFASKGPAYVFSDSNVEVVLTEEEIPEAAIGKLGLSYGIE